jgi:hypothetical protein
VGGSVNLKHNRRFKGRHALDPTGLQLRHDPPVRSSELDLASIDTPEQHQSQSRQGIPLRHRRRFVPCGTFEKRDPATAALLPKS